MTDTAIRPSPLSVSCPLCRAPAGAKCSTLPGCRRGVMAGPAKPTDPHAARLRAVGVLPTASVVGYRKRALETIPRARPPYLPGALYYRVAASKAAPLGGVWLAVDLTLGGDTFRFGVALPQSEVEGDGWSEVALRRAVESWLTDHGLST